MPTGALIAAALGLLALGLSFGGGGDAVPPSRRRSRLKTGPVSSSLLTYNLVAGNVQESLNDIALQIERKTGRSLSLPVIALASMIASEAGSGPRTAKIAVAWAALNNAKATGKSILTLLAPRGQLGAQGISGRSYAATGLPPDLSEIELAQAILEGRISDPTKGSRYFDSPAAFRALEGTEGYPVGKEAARVAKLHDDGFEEFYLPGVSRDYLRLWRRPQATAVT